MKVSEQVGVGHGLIHKAFGQKSGTSFSVEAFAAKGDGMLHASGFGFRGRVARRLGSGGREVIPQAHPFPCRPSAQAVGCESCGRVFVLFPSPGWWKQDGLRQ